MVCIKVTASIMSLNYHSNMHTKENPKVLVHKIQIFFSILEILVVENTMAAAAYICTVANSFTKALLPDSLSDYSQGHLYL